MAVSDRQSVRLERRLRLALRLVIYPLAIGLIVLAWQRTHSQTAAFGLRPLAHWQGQTSQHQAIRLVTDIEDLRALRTSVVMRCTDGSSAKFDIVMTAQYLGPRGDPLGGIQPPRVLKDSRGRAMTVRAWVKTNAGGDPKGTLTATAVSIDGQVKCEVLRVGFASQPTTS